MALRILIADDHAVVTDGVRYLLAAQRDLEVVGTAADGAEAVRLAQEDLELPTRCGVSMAFDRPYLV